MRSLFLVLALLVATPAAAQTAPAPAPEPIRKINPSKMMSATVGLKNAFNTKPPYVNGAGGAFQSGYDPTYVDPHGRFWYVSATLRFQ